MQQKPTSHVYSHYSLSKLFKHCAQLNQTCSIFSCFETESHSPCIQTQTRAYVIRPLFFCLLVCVFSDSHRWTWCCRRKSSRTWRQTGGSIRCIKQDIQQNRHSTVSHGNPVNRICFIFLAAVSYQWFEVSVWKNNCSLVPYVCLLMPFEPTARWALIKLLMMIGAFTPWFSGHYIPIESVSNSQYTPYQGKPIRSIRFLVRTLPVGYDKTRPGCR